MTVRNVSEAHFHEGYVLAVDGKVRSEHQTFVGALKAGFEIKQKLPHTQIKVHEADELPAD